MSYILDALKKADAEREQGQVPGLHTPTGHTDLSDGPQLRTPPLWVMGLGALLVLIALGAVAFLGERFRWLHVLGVVVALSGVVHVIVKGQWMALGSVQWAAGDAWIVAAMVAWAARVSGTRRS